MSVDPVAVTPTSLSARERPQHVAKALSEAARRLRFASANRRGHSGGLRARRGRAVVRALYIGGFFALLAIPTLVAGLYFGLIAANQYEAEARFAVRSGVIAGLDPISSLIGVPPQQIIQDTQVVTDYIGSRALIEEVEKHVDFRKVYSRDEADWWAGLNPEKPIEKIVKYWHSMLTVKIEMPGGIVDLSVRAFRPEDSVAMASAVVAASEKLVNDMNDRARRDAVSFADQELQLASARLAQARAALEVARNREGVLDATQAATSINTIMALVRSQQLQMRQQLETQLANKISRDAPQIRDLRLRIEATDRQLEQLQRELTNNEPAGSPALSGAMTRLSALTLQSRVAETQYAAAAASLERARMASLNKQIYLTSFVNPVMPEDARYPRRIWMCFVIFAGGLVAWGCFCGLVTVVRDHMA